MRQRAILDLFHGLGVPASLTLPNHMLGWEEIRQMKAHNISFGAHTVSHPVLSRLTGAQLKAEILRSRQTIEEKLRMPVRHFAYPFGRATDYTAEARRELHENGFKTAVTTEYGFNSPDDDLFSLKRFTPWSNDHATFILQMDWYRFAGLGNPVGSAVIESVRATAAQAH